MTTALEEQLHAAEAAGDAASATRLKRIISKTQRNEVNRAAQNQNRKRKAEDQNSSLPPAKYFRFTDAGILPTGLSNYRQMLLEEREREQRELERKEAERKEEEARKEEERKKADLHRRREERRQAELRRQAREEADRHRRETQERFERYKRYAREEKARQENERRRQQGRQKWTPPPRPQAMLRPARSTPPVTVQQIQDWRSFATACFNDYSKILTFPAPPGGCCNKIECIAKQAKVPGTEPRALKACDCAIRTAFEMSTISSSKGLKLERLKWHPDRFSKCGEAKREEFQRMAREVFVVVDAVYEESKEG